MNKLKLDTLELSRGSHADSKEGACVMEIVSYIAGEPWSDHPECACPVLSSFLICWNDRMNDKDRQILKPLIPHLIGSRSNAEIQNKRLGAMLDWAFRIGAPEWLDLAGLKEQAQEGRSLGGKANWEKIHAAANANAFTAYTTTSSTTSAIAYAACAAAAVSASWAANASLAANSAASAASAAFVYAAADDGLRPTLLKLQKSALEMINACLDITEGQPDGVVAFPGGSGTVPYVQDYAYWSEKLNDWT